jgi:hypothetical protein
VAAKKVKPPRDVPRMQLMLQMVIQLKIKVLLIMVATLKAELPLLRLQRMSLKKLRLKTWMSWKKTMV